MRKPHLPHDRRLLSIQFIVSTLLLGVFANLLTQGVLTFATTQSQIIASVVLIAILLLLNASAYLVATNLRLRRGQVTLEQQSREVRDQIARLQAELEDSKESERKRLAQIGIVAVAESLKDSHWDPPLIMQRANSGLEFMGCFGHKWVSSDQRIEEFRRMLARIRLNGGKVRFLLVNPNSTDALRIANVRRRELSEEYGGFPSISRYEALARDFPWFELRLSDEFLHLRVLAVDDRCAVSSYLVTGNPHDELEAPQVVISRTPEPECWTLYTPLHELFEYHWERSSRAWSRPPRI